MFIFPYATKQIKEGKLVIPQVELEVKFPFGLKKVQFLVDSGADVTSFPIHPYASLLDARLNPKDKIIIGGVEGKGIAAYPIKINFRLDASGFDMRCYFLASNVDPLLGRLDFWDKFSINFDNKKQQTIISPLS